MPICQLSQEGVFISAIATYSDTELGSRIWVRKSWAWASVLGGIKPTRLQVLLEPDAADPGEPIKSWLPQDCGQGVEAGTGLVSS